MLVGDEYLREVSLKREKITSLEEYPFSIPAIRAVDGLAFHPKVTFFVGENGSGKSTLLEALAVHSALNAEGGSRNFGFGTRASHSTLHEVLRVVRGVRRPKDGYFLRAESFYNLASEIERLDREGAGLIDAYGGVSLHEQSHGEAFLALLTERFFGHGLYFLDEPEAALSPSRQLSVLSVIDDLVGKDSQFVIATHSPILMAYPHATIYLFSDQGIEPIEYKDTEHYRITKDFLNRTEAMLRELVPGKGQRELFEEGESRPFSDY